MIFALYLLLVVIPYGFRASQGKYDFAIGLGAYWVALCHAIFATSTAWQALPGRQERLALWGWLLFPWALAAILIFMFTPVGLYRSYRVEYILLTGACLVGAIQCLGAAGYAALCGLWRPWAMVAGIWFASSAAINGLSRWIYSQADFREQWLRLNAAEMVIHIGCLATWGWLIYRER